MKALIIRTKTICTHFFLPIFLTILGSGLLFADSRDAENAIRTQWNIVRWYEPTHLYELLAEAKKTVEGRAWCEEVESLIGELSPYFPKIESDENLTENNLETDGISDDLIQDATPSSGQHTVLDWDFHDKAAQQKRKEILQKIQEKTQEVGQLISRTKNITSVTRIGRANYGLQRRLVLWKYCDQLLTRSPKNVVQEFHQITSPERWVSVLNAVRETIQAHPYADTWSTYLRYTQLVEMEKIGDLHKQRQLAQATLVRMDLSRLNDSQKLFLSQPAFQALAGELLKIATVPCAGDYLLRSLEEYESASRISRGNELACEYLRVWFSQDAAFVDMLRNFEYCYRNANVRMEISADFLNRLVPQRGPEMMTINEYILNRPVQGQGVTNTNIKIVTVPDSKRFRLGFAVDGSIQSSTVSADNIVQVSNESAASFSAIKEIEVSRHGILAGAAQAMVSNRVQMRHLQTSLDAIPLIGLVANEVARSKAQQQQELARQESQERIRRQVTESLDQEVNSRLLNVNALWREKVQAPLERLGIDLHQMDAETGQHTAASRWRLAGADQPGAHTPRPQAEQRSALNFQVHESAINNLLQQLKLEGRTFTMAEMDAHIALRFPKWAEREKDEDIPEDLTISFPEHDAITVKFLDGQVMLQLSIASLKVGDHEWDNFKIHVPYRVETDGFQAVVQRDGVVRLIGRMRLPQQIAIRGVFSKAFPKDTETRVLPESMVQDPRFATFIISQCVMQDGWLGISVGEQPTVVQLDTGAVR